VPVPAGGHGEHDGRRLRHGEPGRAAVLASDPCRREAGWPRTAAAVSVAGKGQGPDFAVEGLSVAAGNPIAAVAGRSPGAEADRWPPCTRWLPEDKEPHAGGTGHSLGWLR
jgi:hypothetical protein